MILSVLYPYLSVLFAAFLYKIEPFSECRSTFLTFFSVETKAEQAILCRYLAEVMVFLPPSYTIPPAK